MELYLVRHGESQSDLDNVICCEYDAPLTKRGEDQAKALATRLYGISFDALYVSELTRAKATATAIARAINCDMMIEPALNEIRAGCLAGMKWEEAKMQYGHLFDNWAKGIEEVPAGGESQRGSFYPRVAAFYDRLLSMYHNGARVVIVTHNGPANVILNEYFGFEYDNYPAFTLSDASLSVIGRKRGLRSIGFINDVSHLAGVSAKGNLACYLRSWMSNIG